MDFVAQALGPRRPWKVERVRMDLERHKLDVFLTGGHGTRWAEAGQRLPIHGYEERRWRHLNTMHLETVIYARAPRVKYPDGRTVSVTVPWAERYSRWTRLTEAWVIEVLRTAESVSKGVELLQMSWEVIDGAMKRELERGLLRRVKQAIRPLGLDEKSGGRGHYDATVMSDLDDNRVSEIVEHREIDAARQSMESLRDDQREVVQAVAMDMWSALMRVGSEGEDRARQVPYRHASQ